MLSYRLVTSRYSVLRTLYITCGEWWAQVTVQLRHNRHRLFGDDKACKTKHASGQVNPDPYTYTFGF